MSVKMRSVRGNLLILLLFLALTKQTSPKRMYARYIVDLQNLERFESRVVDQLIQKISTTKSQSAKMSTIAAMIDNYVEDFKEVRGLASPLSNITNEEETPASKNPICAYRLLHRIQTTLHDLVSNGTFQQEFSNLAKQVTDFFRVNDWPDETDLEQIIMANLRIQYEYNLKAEELANGWIYKIPTHCTLNSVHCEEFAKVANDSTQYALAIEWLELAKEKALAHGKAETRDLLDSTLKEYIQMHNEDIDGRFGWDPRTFNRKIRPNIPKDSKGARRKRDVLYNEYKNQRESLYKEVAFWGLCSGDALQTEREKANLFCWQEFKTHPILTIGPVKMEFLSRNPDVVQIYEVLNENDMKTMKLGSETNMSDSKVENSNSGSNCRQTLLRPESYRKPVNGLYKGSQEKVFNEKVSRLIGLNVDPTTSEPFQVYSYSPGGLYAPHLDYETEEQREPRDRLATLMIYLNDVNEGGNSAFTSLGVAIKPAKGSAIFWYNAFSDGFLDPAAVHGDCPVILGEKWVSNKWIASTGNLLFRKHGLKPRERFRVPVNNVYLPIPKVFKRGLISDDESVEPESFTKYSYIAPNGLRALAELDEVFYLHIKNIYNEFKKNKGDWNENSDEKYLQIKAYLEDYEESVIKANKHFAVKPGNIVKNPLAAYKLVARFIDKIPGLMKKPNFGDELLTSTGAKKYHEISTHISRIYNTSNGPTDNDMNRAIFSIVNTQFIYDLDAQDIAAGRLDGVDTGVKLNPEDCFNIGNAVLKFKFYSNGIEWLELGLRLMERRNNNFSLDLLTTSYEDIQDALVSAQVSHDEEFLKNNSQESPKMFSRPLSEVAEPSKRIAIKSIQHEDPKYENNSLTRLSKACNGKLQQVQYKPEKLICWYEREIHPTYKIGPIKVELLTEAELEIVQFHDILSEEVTNSLINHTINHPHTPPASYKSTWGVNLQRLVNEHESEAGKKVLQLAKLVTGLNSKYNSTRNTLMVDAYTLGGYSPEHSDDLTEDDMIATFMVYLSDVEGRGETVFTRSGIKILPKRGSAIFWYNRFSCGTPNEWALYGDCPLIFGEKWSSKWLLYSEVQSHFKCHLKPKTPYEILVNGKTRLK